VAKVLSAFRIGIAIWNRHLTFYI